MPSDFMKAGELLLASLSPALDGDIFGVTVDDNGIAGWAIMPMAHYAGMRGHDHFDLSMTLFKEFTKRFSSEFGIHFFLLDSPEKTLAVLKKWMKGANRERKKLIRHACRTLIKQGNKEILRVFGYKPPNIQQVSIDVQTPEVMFGAALQFSVSITSKASYDQPLMIDYIIHHQKANGKTSPKVFKWRTKSLVARKSLTLTKKTPLKKIMTRVYYPGVHTVEIMVNGVSAGAADFQLLIP